MITLTVASVINSVLGGNAPVGYDKFVLSPITIDPTVLSIGAQVKITSTASPDMPALEGSLVIKSATSTLEIAVDRLDFFRRVTLSGAQKTAVSDIIKNAQNSIEAGLISLGVVAGVHAAGV